MTFFVGMLAIVGLLLVAGALFMLGCILRDLSNNHPRDPYPL